MLSSIRFIVVLSLVLILGTTIFFGWYYKNSSDEIILTQVEKANTSIADGYLNTVWNEYRPIIKLIYDIAPYERSQYREFTKFAEDTSTYIKSSSVVKFNIYSPDGKILISSDHSNKAYSNNDVDRQLLNSSLSHLVDPLSVMRKMKTTSEIVTDATFTGLDGVVKDGDTVRTLIPIIDTEAGGTEGLIEIYFEVTDATNTTQEIQYIGMAVIIATFVALIGMMVFSTRRSEKIIEKQYEVNVELNSAKAKAESENEEKSQFLASISHELRTPLNAIIGFSEIIKDEVMGELANQQYKNYITDIHSQGVHLLSLINDILDYSKAEAGKLDIEYEEIDLHKLIANCLRTQEPRANDSKVKLLRELPTEHIVMTTDPKRLKQVLLNLLSNAVKFTPEDGQVKISAWENVTDGRVGIEISDTGIGISPKDLARALSPFGQVDSELSRRYEGTGLGLPLTKKFVELLGGDIEIDSELDKGTKVTVFLPPEKAEPRKNKYHEQDPVAQMQAEKQKLEDEKEADKIVIKYD